jgi:acyl carrier protein
MDFKNKIKNFIEKETQRKIEDDRENLIEKGVLDSFSMIKLLGFIEKELGVKLDMEELTPENFNSLDTIMMQINK